MQPEGAVVDPRTPELSIVPNRRFERELLARVIAELAEGDRPVRVLEAGCGQRWPIDVEGVHLHITGVDLDAEAIRIRRETQGDVDDEIIGDLRTVPLPDRSFDVVYCCFVLEHVEGAEDVLNRLVAATRPGGRLIIKVPDGRTVYGFLVKHSPHRVHVLYKRHIERRPGAGTPGHAPYPTVYDPVVSLPGLREFARSRGLTVVAEYGVNAAVRPFGRAAGLVAWCMAWAGRLTRGRLSGTHSVIGMVLERPR